MGLFDIPRGRPVDLEPVALRVREIDRKRRPVIDCRYTLNAGIDRRYSVHALRHSIAVHLLDAGLGVEFVKDHLGHVNIQNTMIYAQVTDRQRREGFRKMELASEVVKV